MQEKERGLIVDFVELFEDAEKVSSAPVDRIVCHVQQDPKLIGSWIFT